jgi:phosphoribosylanthranilate isomerase
VTRTRIKFCGMTRSQDLAIAAQLGVDAIGFVLVPKSPRFIGAARAAELRRSLPASVSVVVLFQDADSLFVHESIRTIRPAVLQFHGNEDAKFCAGFGLPYMKAVSMHGAQDLPSMASRHPDAIALLLDSHPAGGLGGTGHRFDWDAITSVDKPIVLAGGLDAGNVGAAIGRVRPYGVDVSSGIESAPGVKDSAKMRAFVNSVRAADSA